MTIPFIDLAYQEVIIREDREKRFKDIVENTSFVLGKHVSDFEAEFAEYIGTKRAVGVGGGTHALTMILHALGVGEGDEVITIPTSFIASATPITTLNATPVFVDIDPETRNFDFDALVKAITPRTKVLMPVHLYGQPADMDRVMEIAKDHNLLVVEDACQAHGAVYKGKRVGTFGVAAAFSFFPAKNLGAYGDGGAVVTNDDKVADMVVALRNQGCIVKYDHEYLGYNSRLDALQAAVLSAKLPHLDAWNAMRRAIAEKYIAGLAGLPLDLPSTVPDTESVWHLFVVALREGTREPFMEFLKNAGVASGTHYPVPLHQTPALASLGYGSGAFPHAENLAARVVSLPVYPGMTDEQVEYVIQTVRIYFEHV